MSYFVEDKSWKKAIKSLIDSKKNLLETIPLAIICGMFARYYLEVGPIALLLFVVPLVVGPEIFSTYARLSGSHSNTLKTLTIALEEKDEYTGGHVDRVAKFADYIGTSLGYGQMRLDRLHNAALLHDLGKLIVPNDLLNKPGKLTDKEFEIIKKHEWVTEEILKSITFLKPIAHTAGGDHNKFDQKIKIRNLDPYIVSVCGAFDAMTSTRSYRKALSQEVAFAELRNNVGKQFHPVVVEALIKSISLRGEIYGSGYEEKILHHDAPETGIGSAGIGNTLKQDEELKATNEENGDA